MAYLILEDDGPETGSAYFEFNPGNEASLRKLEALLAARSGKRKEIISEIGEVTENSLHPEESRPIDNNILGRLFNTQGSIVSGNSSTASGRPHHGRRFLKPESAHNGYRGKMQLAS